MADSNIITATAPVGSLDTGKLIKDFNTEQQREVKDIEDDRKLSDQAYGQANKDIAGLDEGLPIIPKPVLSTSSSDRDPSKVWSQSPLKEKGFDSGDYKKMAFAAVGMGDHDLAFQRLEEAIEHKTNFVNLLAIEPFFQPLRTDGRFSILLKTLNLSR